MTVRLKRYLRLIEEHPEFFKNNKKDVIRIITNPIEIQEEESKLVEELHKKKFPKSYGYIGILVEDNYFLIVRDLVEFPNGKKGGYLRLIPKASLEGGSAVAILPVHEDKIILLRNFRHATRNWELEIPRGFGEKGISSEDNARKELLEETGLYANKLIQLGTLQIDTALRSSPVFLFYAEIKELKESTLDTDEVISGKIFLKQTEFEDMIKQRNITDAFTISAYCTAKLWGLI